MPDKGYFTVKESCKLIGLSDSQIYAYINQLNLNLQKHNGKKCLTLEDIEKIKRHKARIAGTQLTMIKNKVVSKNSKTGIRGVSFNNKTKKYRVVIQIKGKVHYLGEFENIKDAKKARQEGEKKHFDPVIKSLEKKNTEFGIGEKYGKLTVIEKSVEKNSKGILYKCLCDCGNIKYVSKYNLINSMVKSCGCLGSFKDITGNRYGRLTAIKRVGKKGKDNDAVWLWQCDCGNTIESPLNNVVHSTHKGKQSCGCRKKEHYAKMDKFIGVHNVEGTCVERIQSRNLSIRNKSDVKGVCWDKSRNMWKAAIYFQGKHYHLGRYVSKAEAAKARKNAEQRLHEPFLEWYYKEYPKKGEQ
jgi:hypothetical protein